MKTTSPQPSTRRVLGTSRLAIGVAALASGLALLLTPLGASGQTTDATAQATSAITITTTPFDGGADCVTVVGNIPPVGVVTVQPFSDANVFQLTVHVAQPLCTPLSAKAVVYAMPANGDTFPQNLLESKDVSFQAAGDTVISFAKACDRVQFDLVSGEPPAVLNTGFDHNLLFAGNLDTAFQHVGNGVGCVDNATSTQAPTTAPTTVAPTTAVVQSATTVRSDPPTTIRASVLAATTVPATSNSGLAVTGTTSGPFALMGGGLVFVGLAFMLASRRRHA